MKIVKITHATSTTGKKYRKIDLQIGNDVKSGTWWEEGTLDEGQEVDWDVVQKGNFTNFYPKKDKNEIPQKTTEQYTHPLTLERIAKLEAQVNEIARHLNLIPKTIEEEIRADVPPYDPADIPF